MLSFVHDSWILSTIQTKIFLRRRHDETNLQINKQKTEGTHKSIKDKKQQLQRKHIQHPRQEYHTIPYYTIPYHTIPYHTTSDQDKGEARRGDNKRRQTIISLPLSRTRNIV